MRLLRAVLLLLSPLAFGACSPGSLPPRIVNVYNFIRNSDDRLTNSQDVLFGATWHQVQLLRAAKIKATWALQYDALINPRYVRLLKNEIGPDDEIAAWWELPRPLVEKAGLPWRGAHDWDSTANIGFAPGYTPDQRRRLVDVYMAEFKRTFGRYPRSVGSWYIDEVTLAYMADRYGIVASCNCKDQIGTDGYTLWGGYWNQAYYPSRANAYMPAQHPEAQINVPIFRMLGSDPIDQFGAARRITSLEPVYPWAGGSATWVDWFFDTLTREPCLAFAYAQAGQENSFGWDAMSKGYELQVESLSRRARAGEIQLQTLAESGEWFRSHFPVTPATAVVALDDSRHQGRRTVWYDSRFYRVNLLWEQDRLVLRDLHLFDETLPSLTHDRALQATALTCGTLPVVDGSTSRLTLPDLDGPPRVTESPSELRIEQPLRKGGLLRIICAERTLSLRATDAENLPRPWTLDLPGAASPTDPHRIMYSVAQGAYHVDVPKGTVSVAGTQVVRCTPDATGELILSLGAR